ncbi:4519_t:CDS:1, partial [Ambispora leptoticha]
SSSKVISQESIFVPKNSVNKLGNVLSEFDKIYIDHTTDILQ